MHFLSLSDFTRDDLSGLLQTAAEVKRAPARFRDALRAKTLALLFLKHSTRTRVSFEAGAAQLGGAFTYITGDTSQLGRGETVRDTVSVLSRYVDAIVARVYEYEQLREIAENSSVPVINGLTNLDHPCQVLSDLFTLVERRGDLAGTHVVFIGAADNNVANSFLQAAPKFRVHFTICAPHGQRPNETLFARAQQEADRVGAAVRFTNDLALAVKDADVLYTDVWFSMHETPNDDALRAFQPYQVNGALMAQAPADAVFMHCMPVHRGWEATDDVVDSRQSIILDQAENRMHVQKAILLALLT
jgi:ornithine carbamoyltransferase